MLNVSVVTAILLLRQYEFTIIIFNLTIKQQVLKEQINENECVALMWPLDARCVKHVVFLLPGPLITLCVTVNSVCITLFQFAKQKM